VIATKDVQWEKAIVLVVTVEEAAQLVTVDRVIGGVDVQHNSVRSHGVGLEVQLDEQVFDGSCTTDDLLVPAILVSPDWGEFESVEGTLARQGLALVTLSEA
jgi:hypothetical protein